jgi:hypothetical protein
MSNPSTAAEVLDREFLLIRAKILEIGAALDRLERAAGDVADDRRLQQIRSALELLPSSAENRAEQIQMIFSLPFDEDWQARFARDGWGQDGRAAVKPK